MKPIHIYCFHVHVGTDLAFVQCHFILCTSITIRIHNRTCVLQSWILTVKWHRTADRTITEKTIHSELIASCSDRTVSSTPEITPTYIHQTKSIPLIFIHGTNITPQIGFFGRANPRPDIIRPPKKSYITSHILCGALKRQRASLLAAAAAPIEIDMKYS